MRIKASILALALGAGVLAACDDTSGPESSKVIQIGGLFSLTGNWSSLGVSSKAALEIGVADVNQFLEGGNSGIRFEAVIEDTKLVPETALSAAQKLKGQGIEVIIGPQSSAEVAAIQSYVNSNSLLVVSQSSTAGSLAVAGDNIFRLTPSDTLESVAIVGLLRADGIETIVPLWRNDAGNNGLANQTRAIFTSKGGVVKAGVQYSATETNFTTALATIKTQVQQAIAERGGTAKVAVAMAAFDEAAQIFAAASGDPVLSSVRWYGTDGTAQIDVLRTNAAASAFSRLVNFASPLPGVDQSAADRWQPIATRIAQKTGLQPDAFALAVYDAVWLIAESYLAAGGKGHFASLKAAFPQAANNFYGVSGWTVLNAAGDRKFGDFDFWILSQQGPNPVFWATTAHYNTQTGVLTRLFQ